jgi:hypothetical protein
MADEMKMATGGDSLPADNLTASEAGVAASEESGSAAAESGVTSPEAHGDLTPESSPELDEKNKSKIDEAPLKNSDKFKQRIKKANGDKDFADDEAFYEKASAELDNLEKYRNNNMEANKALMEIFDAEPEVAEVLKDMVKGASFREAIARHFAPDELMPGEGDPDEEGWKRNAESRSKKLAENEETNKKRAENDDFTMKEIKDFAKDNNLEPDKAEEILGKIGEELDNVYSGKISRNFLNLMYKGFNHEDDVKNAEATGKIAGKNEKIEIKKENKPVGDGLPSIKGGGAIPKEAGKKDWVSNLIDEEKKKQIL